MTLSPKGEGPPPMPWQNYRTLDEGDLRAMHRFVRSLGPRGEQVPEAVPAGQEPRTPYVSLVPVQPTRSE